MNLNMGCGYHKVKGYLNVDLFPECQPDLVYDLESLPWPWENDSVAQVLFNHSLEHIGQTPKVFLGMMQELYRVCKDQARITINVPHPRSDDFINDPTHVRIITPGLLSLFNREINDEIQRKGSANTRFAHYLGVDFYIEKKQFLLTEPYATQYANKQLADADVDLMSREWNNVVSEIHIVLVVRKAAETTAKP